MGSVQFHARIGLLVLLLPFVSSILIKGILYLIPKNLNWLSEQHQVFSRVCQVIKERHEEQIELFLQSDVIVDYSDFVRNIPIKIKLSEWNKKTMNDSTYLYITNIDVVDKRLYFSSQVVVDRNLNLKVFVGTNELSHSELKWLFPKTMKLSLWSQLENLLVRYNVNTDDDISFEKKSLNTVNNHLLKAQMYLKSALDAASGLEYSYKNSLELLLNQVSLITTKRKRYSTTTLIFAFMMYSRSPTCYRLTKDFFYFAT